MAGDYVKTWENWDNAHGQETTGDLYIEQLLPSPDGKRLLINIRSDYRDAGLALLYTLGEREPLILYENSDELSREASRGKLFPRRQMGEPMTQPEPPQIPQVWFPYTTAAGYRHEAPPERKTLTRIILPDVMTTGP